MQTEHAKDNNELYLKWADLLFDVRRSIRYHNYRRKFFDTLGGWADFVVIITGGGVVWFANSGGSTAKLLGAIASILAAADLTIGFSSKARDHHDFARKFSDIEREMIKNEHNQTQSKYVELVDMRLEIEADEPPIKRVLDVYCHNELIKAMGGRRNEKAELGWWRTLIKQWYDWYPEELEKAIEKHT